MKVHLFDRDKKSLRATHGTACGVRLQFIKGKHLAQAPGRAKFTEERAVASYEKRDTVTCGACLKVMDARWAWNTLHHPRNKPA